MKQLKWILIFFLTLNFKGLSQQELFTTEFLDFEEAYIQKSLGDLAFVKGDREFSQEYYTEALKYFKNFKESTPIFQTIQNSEHYSNKYLPKYLKLDLDYKLKLLEYGADYYGLKYHNRVLPIKERYERFKARYDSYQVTVDEVIEMIANYDSTNSELTKIKIRELDNIQAINLSDIKEFYSERIGDRYERLIKSHNSSIKELNTKNQKLADETSGLMKSLNQNEKAISSAVQGYVQSQVTGAIIDTENFKSINEFTSLANPESIKNNLGQVLIEKVALGNNEFSEFMMQVEDAKNIYTEAKKNYETISSIDFDEILENPSVVSITENGLKLTSVLSKYESTREFAKEAESQIIEFEKSYSQLKQAVQNGIDIGNNRMSRIKNCIENPSCECINYILDRDWFPRKFGEIRGLNEADLLNSINCPQYETLANEIKNLKDKDVNFDDLISLSDKLVEFGPDSVKQQWELVKTRADSISNLINKDSLKYKFEEIGEIIIKELPENYKKQWETLVKSGNFDVTTIILEEFGPDSVKFYNFLNQLIQNEIDDSWSNLDEIIFGLIKQLIQDEFNKEGSKIVISEIVKLFYYEITPYLDEDFRQELRRYARVQNGKFVFNSNRFANNIVIVNDQIKIRDTHQVSISNLLHLPVLQTIESAKVKALRQIFIEYLGTIQNQATADFKNIDFEITKLVEALQYTKIDRVNVSKVLVEKKVVSLEKTVNQAVGSHYFFNNTKAINDRKDETQKILSNIPTFVKNNKSIKQSNDDISSGVQDQIATMALNYAFPGASVGIGVATKVFDSYDLIDQINSNTKEMKLNQTKIFELYTDIDKSRIEKEIWEMEEEIASYTKEISKLKEKQYEDLKRNLLRKQNVTIELLKKFALKRLFYESEILKTEYFLLDKSVQFWASKSIKDLVISDPRNYIYVYDPEIQLISWFDRTGVRDRTDIEYTREYWKNIYSVLSQNIEQYFSESDQNFAPDASHLISINEIKESEISEVKDLPDGEEITFNLIDAFMVNAPEAFRNNPPENFRIIDFKIAGIDNNNDTKRGLDISHVDIENLGRGRVRRNGITETQLLVGKKASISSLNPDELNNQLNYTQSVIDKYKDNWYMNDSCEFLGYAVDSSFKFTLHSAFFEEFKDLVFRFYFISTNSPNFDEFEFRSDQSLIYEIKRSATAESQDPENPIKDIPIYYNSYELGFLGFPSVEELNSMLLRNQEYFNDDDIKQKYFTDYEVEAVYDGTLAKNNSNGEVVTYYIDNSNDDNTAESNEN